MDVTFMIDFGAQGMPAYKALGGDKLSKAIRDVLFFTKLDTKLDRDDQYATVEITTADGFPTEDEVRLKLNGVVDKLNKALPAKIFDGGTAVAPDYLVPFPGKENDFQTDDYAKDISCVRYEWVGKKLVAIYNYKIKTLIGYDPATIAGGEFKHALPRFCVVGRFEIDYGS